MARPAKEATEDVGVDNPFLDLELPPGLPEDVRAKAEPLLRGLKEADGAMKRTPFKTGLADLGVFDDATLYPNRKVKPLKTGEIPARASDRSELPLEGGASQPAPKNSDAEKHLLNGFIRVPDFRPKFLEITSPEQFRGVSQRKAIRLAVELHDAGRPVEYVLMRDLLSRDGTAVDIGAAEALDDAMSCDVQSEETLLELARNVRARHAEKEEASARRKIADLSLDGGLRNGVYLAKLSEIVEGLGDRAAECHEDDSAGPRGWPEPVHADAYYGLAGKILGIVSPQTVADPVAILTQFLTAFGSIVGRGPCWYHEDTRHSLALYTSICGPTAMGGKGTAWNIVDRIVSGLDPSWEHTTGLISGEGLIDELKAGDPKLFVEEEFAAILAVAGRKGSSLGPFLRKGWDGRTLGKRSANNPTFASKYHIAGIFHITIKELIKRLDPNDKSNGHVNRFMWCCSRSRDGDIERKPIDWDKNNIRKELRDTLEWVRSQTAKDPENGLVLIRDAAAKKLWAEYKPRLRAAGGGPLGPLRARALPITMRLAGNYAVLDRSSFITPDHLRAAMAVWEFCSRSVAFIFRGGAEELSDAHGRAFRKIIEYGSAGITVRELARRIFRHKHEPAIEAIEELLREGLIVDEKVKTGGASKTLYKASRESLAE